MMQKLIAVLTLAAALLAAGCGGSDSDESGQTTPADKPAATKAEFIKAADEICGDYDDRIAPIEDKFERLENTQEWEAAADLLHEAADITAEGQDQIEALDPPPADAETIRKYLQTTGDGVALVRQLGDAFDDHDTETAQTLSTQAQKVAAKAHGIAQGYGFTECGSDD
jgi:hypothetical protein